MPKGIDGPNEHSVRGYRYANGDLVDGNVDSIGEGETHSPPPAPPMLNVNDLSSLCTRGLARMRLSIGFMAANMRIANTPTWRSSLVGHPGAHGGRKAFGHPGAHGHVNERVRRLPAFVEGYLAN